MQALLHYLAANSSSVVAAAIVAAIVSLAVGLVNAFVSLRISSRGIKVDNVTKERAKWRDNVRAKALEVHKAAVSQNKTRLHELYLEFSLLLNPRDREDRAISNLIHKLAEKEEPAESYLRELVERISLLLKHDWQRAKREAKSLSWLRWPARRMKYEKFKRKFPAA
jgi:hypothetical protein